MESAMTHKKKLQELQRKQDEASFTSELSRARSVTVGTSFGGTTELMMRGNGGSVLWAVMQPVEVIELIHQLAANVGCHIHIQPRRDFASWRDWKYTEEELAHYRGVQNLPGVGHPPHVNDMAPHNQVGANLPAPEEQPGFNKSLIAKDGKHETVAIEKPKHRRSAKRTSKVA